MKEDSIEDLKKRIAELERLNAALDQQVRYSNRVVDVLVAVGVVPERKLEQAREIVSSLAD